MIARLLFMSIILVWLSGCSLDRLGGAFKFQPQDIGNLSEDAKQLVAQAIGGLDPTRITDYHAHALSTGSSGNDSYLGMPLTNSFTGRIMADLYKSGSGVTDDDQADQQFVTRLLDLRNHSGFGGKTHLLAYDQTYFPDGSVNDEGTLLYVPNSYVYQLSQKYPEHFVPVISVHPHNPNAIEEIHRWGKMGVRFLKWSAPMMEIEPGDSAHSVFYHAMKENDMVLLSHGGPYSRANKESQHFGNPQYLKLPLSIGVKVIVAHSASGGECYDIESAPAVIMPCFDLFVRMLENPQYDRLLFGDISAILNSTHLGKPLRYLLAHPELHERLIYGSDYPGPAINVVINTSDLVDGGFVSVRERKLLNEIYHYNPLLFDLVMQRTVKHPESGAKFSNSIFQQSKALTF